MDHQDIQDLIGILERHGYHVFPPGTPEDDMDGYDMKACRLGMSNKLRNCLRVAYNLNDSRYRSRLNPKRFEDLMVSELRSDFKNHKPMFLRQRNVGVKTMDELERVLSDQ